MRRSGLGRTGAAWTLGGALAVAATIVAGGIAWTQTAPASPTSVPAPAPPRGPSFGPPPGAQAGPATFTEGGLMQFESRCLSCHGNPDVERAPSPEVLRAMPPERIYAALTSGPMKAIGDALTDVQKRQIAELAAGRLMGAAGGAAAKDMPNQCPSNPPLQAPGPADWNGWGVDRGNGRYQPASGITAANAPKLKLKWAFGLPGSTSAYSQPVVVSGHVFVGTDRGYVYSIDAKTGCIHWSFQAKSSVRNAIVIGRIAAKGPKPRWAAYFGDLKANAYAVDADTGDLIWTTHVDDHITARVTASPALWGGRLFVPISSWESSSAKSLDYPCCTFVGNVTALDANTGKPIWKRYVFDKRPAPIRKNAKGVQLYAPAGSAVWNTPTVDPKRGAVYFGTGDASTWPAPDTADSVIAADMATGKVLWTFQVHKGDASLVGCWADGITENCPKEEGPDWDVPGSPILRTLKDGQTRLIVATKPGDVLALDPDHKGRLVWRMNINGPDLAKPGPPDFSKPPLKGMLFGGAADQDVAYFGLQGGGVTAVRLSDGEKLWLTPLDAVNGARVAYPAATSATPGLVWLAGSDGVLSAVSMADGRRVWRFDTTGDFDTVNKVAAHGGSFGSGGVTAAEGMVFAGSGYAVSFTKPGNVLLAFAPN